MPNSVLVFPSDSTAIEPRFHPPCDLAAFSATSLSAQASATVAAGAAGIRHVVTGATFSMAVGISVLATTTVALNIIDGSSGGTTFLWSAVVSVSSSGLAPYSTPSLNIPGSPATALTAEFSKAISTATQFVSLSYHDIGNV